MVLVQIIFTHNPHTCRSICPTGTSRHLSQHKINRCQAPEARTWRLAELHRQWLIAFHPGASSMVQRDENHSVPDQGCREDGPVPPNRSDVTTHACWPAVIKGSHRTPQQVGDEFQLVMCLLVAEIWSQYAPQCLTMFPPAPPTYNWCWDSMTVMRRGLVSVRGSSALSALTWQEIWVK
jgi:hypothetical protein